MSLPVQTPFNNAVGNGVSTVFGYTFLLLSADEVEVTVGGVLRVLGVDYTVSSIGNVSGGNVTFTAPPGNGLVVRIRRRTPSARSTEYQDGGDLPADTLNPDFDRLWMRLQEIAEELGRSLQLPATSTTSGLTVPEPQAARFLRWRADNTGLENAELVGSGLITIPVAIPQGGTGGTTPDTAVATLLGGASRRFTADFSNATLATRAYFQAATVNASTSFGLLPNGTGPASSYNAFGAADPTNASQLSAGVDAAAAFVSSTRTGSGTFRPLRLATSDITRFEIDINGNIVVGTGAALAGLRIATIGNSNAAANSGSAWSTNSNAGSTSIVAWSAATGSSGFGAVQTDMPGGLSLVSLSATGTLNFLTNNLTRLTIRADGSIWTDANTRPSFRCRAWVQFNGATGAMAGSGNVSSVTRNSLGNYTINFATAQPDTAYSVSATVNAQSGGGSLVAPYVTPPSSTANFQIQCLQDSGASPADTITHVAVFR